MRLWIGSLSVLLLVIASHCASKAGSPRLGTADIVLVRRLTTQGGAMEFSSRGELAVLTGNTLAAIAPAAILGDEITGRTLALSEDGGLLAASTNSSLVVLDLDGSTEIIRKTYPIDHILWSMGALAFAPGCCHTPVRR